MKYKLVTTIERKDLIEKGDKIVVQVWPEFILHDAVANEYFFQLYEVFPEFQYWLLDGEEIVGIGNSIPILWKDKLIELPEEGWDWALEKGFSDKEKDRIPNILCAMSITINPKYQGKGVSKEMINAMVRIGKNFHLDYLVVPVRPTLKKDYPLVDMKRYINWNRDDGLPFDPWLRVHARLGGEIVKVCSKAMRISGKISDWEGWTGMKFPVSGEYIIPGALKPVNFDKEKDEGLYVEPNVWVVHRFE